MPATAVVCYPADHTTLGAWNGSWNPRKGIWFGGGTTIRGVVFPAGTRCVLFFGTQGIGPFCYGEGTTDKRLAGKPTPDGTIWCYDADDSSKAPMPTRTCQRSGRMTPLRCCRYDKEARVGLPAVRERSRPRNRSLQGPLTAD